MKMLSSLSLRIRIILSLLFTIYFAEGLIAQPFEKALSEQEVKKWFVTIIDAFELQLKYKSNAAEYDDVIVAYYKERDAWLPTVGYSADEFDALTERVYAGYSSMEDQEDVDQQKKDLQPQIDEINGMAMLSEEQKKMMKSSLMEMINQQQELIDYFKPDWPALKKYQEEYVQLDLWMSYNRDTPPTIE